MRCSYGFRWRRKWEPKRAEYAHVDTAISIFFYELWSYVIIDRYYRQVTHRFLRLIATSIHLFFVVIQNDLFHRSSQLDKNVVVLSIQLLFLIRIYRYHSIVKNKILVQLTDIFSIKKSAAFYL